MQTQPRIRTRDGMAPVVLHREIWRVVHDAICQRLNIPHISRGDKAQPVVRARLMFVSYLQSIGYSGYRIAEDLQVERSYITIWKRTHADRVVYDAEYRREWCAMRKHIDDVVREWESERTPPRKS